MLLAKGMLDGRVEVMKLPGMNLDELGEADKGVVVVGWWEELDQVAVLAGTPRRGSACLLSPALATLANAAMAKASQLNLARPAMFGGLSSKKDCSWLKIFWWPCTAPCSKSGRSETCRQLEERRKLIVGVAAFLRRLSRGRLRSPSSKPLL